MKLKTLLYACMTTFVSYAAHADELTVFDHVRVFDGTGAPAKDNQKIVVDGFNIVDIGPADGIDTPAGARVVDYTGKTIMPGIISDHVHLGVYDATVDGSPYTQSTVLRQLRQYQAYGVTTVASLGLNGELFYALRPQLHQGTLDGADIFGADRGIGVPAGGPAVKVSSDQLDRPATPEEARADVRAAALRGTNLIKIWFDDFQEQHLVKMKPDIYLAVIDEAHKNGLRVAAHIYYLNDAKDLVRAGVDILAHGVRDREIDDEFIALMREKKAWYIPTIGLDEAFFRFAEEPSVLAQPLARKALNAKLLAQYESPKWRAGQFANPEFAQWHTAFKVNLINTKKLVDAGINVGFGTDSGAMPLRVPGYAEHRELQLLVQAGLTPAKALTLATSKAASELHLHDRGRLQVGMRADLIVTEGDPSVDLGALDHIVAVWRGGVPVVLDTPPF